jgi:carbon-monoxide dehydrogenase small subunit
MSVPQGASYPVRLEVNGHWREGLVEPRRTLADFLREDLDLTGTHLACEHGFCGNCNVLVDGKSVRSCLMLAVQADGHEVKTVEGLAHEDHQGGQVLHPVQEAFRECHALQCGFCTPGMIMQSIDLLKDNPTPTEQEIREGIEGNLCRCTGYHNIVRAVQTAAGTAVNS